VKIFPMQHGAALLPIGGRERFGTAPTSTSTRGTGVSAAGHDRADLLTTDVLPPPRGAPV